MTYTNEQINAALNKALDEKGEDYVYPQADGNCVYSLEGEPSCIVGHVLHTLDPEMFKRVAEFERDYDQNGGDTSFGVVVTGLGLPFETEQRRALQNVQSSQDSGHTWEHAVAVEWMAALGEKL